jgi:peptide/nickel transport system permease protein
LGTYVDHLFHGNLGSSFLTNQPVTQIISQGLSPSLQLAAAALLLVMVISIPLGLVAAALTQEGRHRRFELAFTTITSVGGAIPDFLTATVLAFLFAVEFRLFPAAGSGSFAQLVLPAIAVAAGPIWILARLVRLETLNVLAQDYIRTARSQRLPWPTVYARHVLPNVLTAALTIAGLLFANLIGGAVIVENVFNRQGLGTELVNAVLNKELVVVEGIALLLGAFILVVIVLVDVLLSVIDPRSLARRS